MKTHDLLGLAWKNLRRQKLRTILTALGVMIGCTSIVVMISIGNGLEESQQASLASMGDLRNISIYNYGGEEGTSKITDDAIEQIRAIPHVQSAAAKMQIDDYGLETTAKNGRYQADWMNLIGIDKEMIPDLGFEVTEGSLELGASTATRIPVLIGSNMAYNFRDTLRPDGSNYISAYPEYMFLEEEDFERPEPFFNPLGEELSMKVNTSWEENAQGRSYTLVPVGILKENYGLGYETVEGVIMNLSDMQKILRQADKDAGKPARTLEYQEAMIQADSIDNVSSVEKELKNMGYSPSSMNSIRESMQEQSRTIQMILGGIGAVSLLVAAIGIMNTMVMSISERTREIGIMKAIGCAPKDIRLVFLTEAALIGLIGGTAGLLFSYLISTAVNYFAWSGFGSELTFQEFLFTAGGRISVIPLWLMLFALAFSMGIGLISGAYPSAKAVRIPAIEAIRRE